MKLVMTVLVRDEVDIIDAHLAYHLDAGVDFVVAIDHRSGDGTTEILESYACCGVLQLLREEGEYAQQAAWQTRMARLAATEHGADWVINSDADEFWFPRGSSLKGALDAVDAQFGVVHALVRNFVPPRDDHGWFADRMTLRLAEPAPLNDPATAFRPVAKVAHRGEPGVVLAKGGGHQVFGVRGATLRAWHPLEVLHLPFRSRDQCAGKYRKTWTGWERNLRGDLARARQASEEGRGDAVWDRVALDGAACERGLAEGSLVIDTRLREALDSLRSGTSRRPRLPDRRDLDEHAYEAAVFQEAEAVRLMRWADDVARRVRVLEDASSSRPPTLRHRMTTRLPASASVGRSLRASRAATLARRVRDAARAASWRFGVAQASDALLSAVRGVLGHAPPRVSVVIPTLGRETLQAAIDSAGWAHQIVVVYDAAEVPPDAPAGVDVYACGPTGNWGAEQRNLGISRASGTHIAFLDDDDVYTSAAGKAVSRALRARPGRVHIFKMRAGDRVWGGHGCVWDGGIGTPMFVVPNDGRVARWTTRYQGDFDFIESTLAARFRPPRFHPEVVVDVTPRTRR